MRNTESARELAGGVTRRRRFRLRWPGWLDRLLDAGIVSADGEVRRRQRFVNLAAFVAAIATFAHMVEVGLVDFDALFRLVVHNGVFALVYLATPLFHRLGRNAGGVWLVGTIILGNLHVVWLTGTEGGAQVYFTLAAISFLFFGVAHWRWFAFFALAALAALLVSLRFFPRVGPVGAHDPEFLVTLSDQILVNALVINVWLFAYALVALHRAEKQLQSEHRRSESLLRAILPGFVAERLKARPHERIADRHEDVTIVFADLVGFTTAARHAPPEDVVGYLDGLFRALDGLAETHGVEKIKTIGDAYMAVAGLDEPGRPGAERAARFALALRELVLAQPALGEARLSARIGLHTGPAVAGVIGDKRFSYDIWGDAVNMAARMESHGVPGAIQLSEATAALLAGAFRIEPRGEVRVKGIGTVRTFLLLDAQAESRDGSPVPAPPAVPKRRLTA